ncbi:type I-E CRISPR-associated protein Cse1/CasA [Streptomyces gobiensis]|uniref:type I-E CRISPR-associated protein Cse1/CasA n=1 Tax=Streptomyces gobiensis TaxID=2875706 RepID=UPI001E652AAC|nr:type I-E CRISPR-associated protein Cse1/CasA [Streptomyces gobiensis]UGY93721.1 type I-E CRISPR-associated protein Cse1/CasA [Streptomyces gobiensis]
MPSERPVQSFDLISQPWIPVQDLSDAESELSLLDVFAEAKNLRRLVGDIPTQEFALLRLLLAIVHDAVDGPADLDAWSVLREDGLPCDDIAAYLDEHRERFDLLHPETPFFQVAGLHTAKNEVASLDRIVADVPNGERFFTMRAQGAGRLGFAEAARWVVHAHAYDPSGIKSGAVGDSRVKGGKGYPQGVGWAGNLGGVLAEGADLRETLLLNLIATDTENLRSGKDDRPAWRREPPGPGEADPVELASRPSGVRDLYTWQSRRLRLHYDADGVHGVVLGYGDPLTPRNKQQHEPMTAWRRSPVQEKKLREPQVYLPREHDPTRTAWRGLAALVTGAVKDAGQRQEPAKFVRPRILDWVARLTVEDCLEEDFLIRARLFGAVYGTQQSVIDEVVDDGVKMAVVLLHDQDSPLCQAAIGAVSDAEETVYAVLGDLAADLAQAAGAEPSVAQAAARDLGFATLDGPFRAWLRDLKPGHDPHERRQIWQHRVHQLISGLGDDLLKEAGDAAWEGRVIDTRGGGSLWLTASSADLRFRRRLRDALPLTNA